MGPVPPVPICLLVSCVKTAPGHHHTEVCFLDVHRAVVAVGLRKNWIALGADGYVDWLTAIDSVALFDTGDGFELRSTKPIDKLAFYWPGQKEERVVLPLWQNSVGL